MTTFGDEMNVSSQEVGASEASDWCTRHAILNVVFNIPPDTLYLILETLFPANHLTGAKTQSFQPVTSLVLANLI